MLQSIFREYDIRGIADKELLDPDVQLLGQALGTYIQRNAGKNINLGRDCRLSGERLSNALRNGLLASGCNVTELGVVPTPITYFSAVHMKSDGAVMITGSHNPSEYNGFKTVCGSGTLHGKAIQEVYRMIQARDFLTGAGTNPSTDIVTPYVEDVASRFNLARRIKVVVDAGNGTGGPAFSRILKT